MKLYRITLKGMVHSIGSQISYGNPYVIANSLDEALKKVQDYLIKKDFGYYKDRELDHIDLLAEEGDYPNCGIQLYL